MSGDGGEGGWAVSHRPGFWFSGTEHLVHGQGRGCRGRYLRKLAGEWKGIGSVVLEYVVLYYHT